jgi:uncharacterized protein YvpB
MSVMNSSTSLREHSIIQRWCVREFHNILGEKFASLIGSAHACTLTNYDHKKSFASTTPFEKKKIKTHHSGA